MPTPTQQLPPAPENFKAFDGYSYIPLEWSIPYFTQNAGYSYTEIYAAKSSGGRCPPINETSLVVKSPDKAYWFLGAADTEYCFFAYTVDGAGNKSQNYAGPVKARTAINVGQVIDLLEGRLQTSTPSDASVCFPSYVQAGKSYSVIRKQYGQTDVPSLPEEYKLTYTNCRFDGEPCLAEDLIDAKGTSINTRFIKLDSANKIESELGSKYGSLFCSFSPSVEHRFSLLPGGTYNTDHTASCYPSSGAAYNASVSQKITFASFEKLTVPAGTFDTCKAVVSKQVFNGAKSNSTLWLRQGDGVLLREDFNGKISSELISFTPK